MVGTAGASGPGNGSLQNGHVTGRKFGDTIFLPQAGQMSGPDVVSGGLKHMAIPFPPRAFASRNVVRLFHYMKMPSGGQTTNDPTPINRLLRGKSTAERCEGRFCHRFVNSRDRRTGARAARSRHRSRRRRRRLVLAQRAVLQHEGDLRANAQLALHFHARARPEVTANAIVDVLHGDAASGGRFGV